MPLNDEFARKAQQQARELIAAVKPQNAPQEHPEDTLIVRNVLVGVDCQVEEPIPYASSKSDIDPNTGQQHFVNRIDTNVYNHSWNTKDYFEVRWGGRPHRIKPGQTRHFPRYLADHFAKHLIDFILTKREKDEGVTGLKGNRTERVKLYEQIIVDVASYYNADLYDYQAEGEQVERQVAEMNAADNAFNAGVVPNQAIGYTTDVPSKPAVSVAPAAQGRTREEIIASKKRTDLLKEAKELGIELTGHETKEQLYTAISNF